MNAAEAPWQQRIRKSRRVESAGSQQPDAASSLPDSDWRPLDIPVETETNIRAMGGQGRDPGAIRSLMPQTTRDWRPRLSGGATLLVSLVFAKTGSSFAPLDS